MSSRSVPTTLIGPKGLLRDSLASLLGSYSYRVTESVASASEMPKPTDDEEVRMVLLTVRTMEQAVAEAARARQVCPHCKIVALLEDIVSEDFQKLAHSAIDGCVPLHVSQDVLTRTLDLVMSDTARIIVLASDERVSTAPEKEQQRDGSSGGAPPRSDKNSATEHDEPTLVPSAGDPKASHTAPDGAAPGTLSQACSTTKAGTVTKAAIAVSRPMVAGSRPIISIAEAAARTEGPANTRRLNRHLSRFGRGAATDGDDLDGDQADAVPALSERERQIIDGLVKGQPNKTIARVCGITEATVKVHMKAILRKVPCSNRTQVAIWALDHPEIFAPRADGGPAIGLAE